MMAHLRANLWLLVLTVVLCSMLYPLVLLGLGQTVFPNQAEGSLINDKGQVAGSRLIAQPFKGDQYFQPRPSAASYKADASGASNLGPNNYLLRERVAQSLGPIVKYGPRGARPGQLVSKDVEAWLHDHPEAVAAWESAHGKAPGRWLKADKANAALVADWKKADNKDGEPAAEDVVPFFQGLAAGTLEDRARWSDDQHAAVQAIFFESWRDAHPEADLEPVPADMVTTSGSGLDPHITLSNAMYQLDRVAENWAKLAKPGADEKEKATEIAKKKQEITEMLNSSAEAPFGGLAGVNLVNVLEINLALKRRYGTPPTAGR